MKKLNKTELLVSLLILVFSFFGCQKEGIFLASPTTKQAVNKDTIIVNKDTTAKDTLKKVPSTPIITPSVSTADYFVSPDGNDNNPGTYDKPFKSIEKAYSVATAGKLFYFRGGIYKPNNPGLDIPFNLIDGNSGTSTAMIKFWAYPGETPIIDLSSLNHTGETVWGIQFTGDYWYWKGFEIRGFPALTWQYVHQAFVIKNSSNCIFENLVIHDNKAMGLDLMRNSDNNLIKNCDAYNNQDPETTTDPYGNADGFHFGYLDAGTTNTIEGCRSWYNSDDGYDCYGSDGKIIFNNCWAFYNGYQNNTFTAAGDGDGFKLGGTQGNYTDKLRDLTNCISAKNKKIGFDQNDGVFATSLTNCINYGSGDHGIYLNKYNETNYFKNCISVNAGSGYNALVSSESTLINCSWKGYDVTDNNFVSVDHSELLKARNSDYSLPDIQFLKIAANSAYKW